ncbi:MAG: CRTAC1 family protein, partial [Deltaproteobacteria bacterium]|nr:CRTAC1 family protein [Deltaproteobacteria bacterium]
IVSGSLLVDRHLAHGLGDLTRALASFAAFDALRLTPLRWRRFPRRALIRARYLARGVDRLGARRVDSGIVDLDLSEHGGRWRIDDFRVARVFTLRRVGAGYRARRDWHPTSVDVGPLRAVGRAAVMPRARAIMEGPVGVFSLAEARGNEVWAIAFGPQGPSGAGRRLIALAHGAVGSLTVADFDGDGRSDLFVGSTGSDSGIFLWRGGIYRRWSGLRVDGPVVASVAADLDGDGHLDLYLTRQGKARADLFATPGATHLLVRGPLGREHRSTPRPMPRGPAWGLQTCVGDLDGDGRADLVLVDALEPPHVWRRAGDRFVRAVQTPWMRGPATACVLGDVDGDGRLDLYLGALSARHGFLFDKAGPEGSGRMRRITAAAGAIWINRSSPGRVRFVRAEAMRESVGWTGWGAFVDHDCDGDLDLWRRRAEATPENEDRWWWMFRRPGIAARHEPLGIPRFSRGRAWRDPRYAQEFAWRRQELWINDGRGGLVEGAFAAALPPRGQGAGVAVDVDGDGRLDLFGGEPMASWRGSSGDLGEVGAGSAAVLRIHGASPSNRDAIGAVIRIRAALRWQTRVVGFASGWPGAPPGWVHVGLGAALRIERLEVRWPDGRREVHDDLPVNRRIEIAPGQPPRWYPFGMVASSRPVAPPPPTSRPSRSRGGLLVGVGAWHVRGADGQERALAAAVGSGDAVLVFARTLVPPRLCTLLRARFHRVFTVGTVRRLACGTSLHVNAKRLASLGGLLPAVAVFRGGKVTRLWAWGTPFDVLTMELGQALRP